MSKSSSMLRVRWSAVGAALTVALGAGGIGIADAVQSSGERGAFTSIEPCRLIDTRSEPALNVGDRTTPLGADETFRIEATGSHGECEDIPDDAIAIALNVTPVAPTRPTNLRFFPEPPVPNASSLNPTPGQPPTPNAVTVDLAGDGSFRVYNFRGRVDLVADIVGTYRNHNHDDRYFTKGQVNAKVADIVGTHQNHNHDDRYFTKGQVNAKVADAGFEPWDEIPSGETVTGMIHTQGTVGDTYGPHTHVVDLPGYAPVALTSITVDFQPSAPATDSDPQCAGTAAEPTAPPGHVCIYAHDWSGIATFAGDAPLLATRSFEININPSTVSPDQKFHLEATWAYTAP